MKNTMNELKNATESNNNKMDQVEERIEELEDRTFEHIHSENKEKRMKKHFKKCM